MIEKLINLEYCCVAINLGKSSHDEIDTYGKANNLTIVYADWHPNPQYRVSKTGSFLSRNEKYPSGLILVDNKGEPHPYKKD